VKAKANTRKRFALPERTIQEHRCSPGRCTLAAHLGPKIIDACAADNPDGFWDTGVRGAERRIAECRGARDLPPATRTSNIPGLTLRLKARLLIERFDSANVWGWKDPRNSLTVPFWQDLLPGLKTLIVVRNPLEVAYSMRQRNGTSYSFGLRLWEIYNRRVIEASSEQERFVTHYDFFFENAKTELLRIARFIGLPNADVPAPRRW
jgi:hypothetical protein